MVNFSRNEVKLSKQSFFFAEILQKKICFLSFTSFLLSFTEIYYVLPCLVLSFTKYPGEGATQKYANWCRRIDWAVEFNAPVQTTALQTFGEFSAMAQLGGSFRLWVVCRTSLALSYAALVQIWGWGNTLAAFFILGLLFGVVPGQPLPLCSPVENNMG